MARKEEIKKTFSVEQDGFDPENCEFKTMEDYDRYNNWARKNGRHVKVPEESFYNKVRIKFQRFDQPENILKCRVRNREIDWTGQLKPGGIYELPMPVIKFLTGLSVPKYGEVKVNREDGVVTETKQVGEISRFSCQILDYAA